MSTVEALRKALGSTEHWFHTMKERAGSSVLTDDKLISTDCLFAKFLGLMKSTKRHMKGAKSDHRGDSDFYGS